MNKIIFVLFLITLLSSGELEELEKAKLFKKNQKLTLPSSGTISVILKKEDETVLKKIAKMQDVKLKICILPTMCLFEVKKNLAKTLEQIKKLPSIKKAELLQKHQFNPY